MVTKTIAFATMLAGCTTLVKTEPVDPNVKTLSMQTGRLVGDGPYQAQFAHAAEGACSRGYTILERTRTPSTLAGHHDLSAADFYWVIRCKS